MNPTPMKLTEIKQRMLDYRDFYGADIPQSDLIKNATTEEELRDIIYCHKRLLEDMLSDAISHLENFERILFET